MGRRDENPRPQLAVSGERTPVAVLSLVPQALNAGPARLVLVVGGGSWSIE